MAIYNATKSRDDFIPWPDRGPNRPPKTVVGKRISKQRSRPEENWYPSYSRQITALVGAGCKPQEVANALNVRLVTYEKWVRENYACQMAVAKGTYGLRAAAFQGLAMRATGFEIDTEKVFVDKDVRDAKGNARIIRAKTMEYYPPDVSAALAILRQHSENKTDWVPPARVEHSGPDGAPLALAGNQTFNTLMLLGSSPDDQQKAAAAYQQLIRGAKSEAK